SDVNTAADRQCPKTWTRPGIAIPDRQSLAIRVPHDRSGPQVVLCKEICQHLARRAAESPDIKPLRNTDIKMRLEQDPRTIGRPSRAIAEGCDLSFSAAQCGYDEQTALALFGAVSKVFPIGRPVRLPIAAWSFSDLHGIATTYLLHPDIELAATIGAVGNETAVG